MMFCVGKSANGKQVKGVCGKGNDKSVRNQVEPQFHL